MVRPRLVHALFMAAPLVLGACALKSPPSREELARTSMRNTQVPAGWTKGTSTQDAVVADWLASFGEPRLNALVAEALEYNSDLAASAARIEQAAAVLKIAGGALTPAVDLLGRANHKMSGGGSTDLTGAILSASWEIDLWGRVRYGARAADEDYRSAQADYEYARQSIAALVAKSWLVAAEASLHREIARESVGASERTAELARVRLRVGSGDDRDVALANASLQTYRDTIRQLEYAREQALRALEVLAGRYPAAALAAATTLPMLPPTPAAGVPGQLLERRPDVIAAERRIAAAFSRVGEAQAARLPRISLTAGLSYITGSYFVRESPDKIGSAVGALLQWPLFAGGALEGQVELRTAEQKRAVAEYAAIGLKAFNEVESALSAEATLSDREQLLRQLTVENERAVSLSEVSFKVGKIDQRAVLTDQLQLYASRVLLLRVRSEMLAQRVNLYLALGGGLAPADAATPAAGVPVGSQNSVVASQRTP